MIGLRSGKKPDVSLRGKPGRVKPARRGGVFDPSADAWLACGNVAACASFTIN
jgi:hypothetical protein